MSTTRAGDRPGRSHVPPTPPAKLAPADDPAWAATFMLADAAREARPTTTNEETTTMPIDQSAYVFGEPIPYDHVTAVEALAWLQDNAPTHTQRSDEWTRWSVGARYLASAVAELADERLTISVGRDTAKEARDALAPPTDKDDTRTLEWNGVTVTIGTSSGVDGAALVIIDTEGEPDGSDGWKGLRVEVHVGQRPKWYTLDEWLRTTHNLTDDEEAETVASEITDAMANLAGFLYSAQIGAINALSAKSRP